MDEKRNKQDQNTILITSDLITKISNQSDFSKITSLIFPSKSGKIRVSPIQTLENFSECTNLQVLTLSSHLISKIENLEALTRLKELDLSENKIQKLENLNKLSLLESLNLSGNSLKELPKSSLEPLKCLKTLKISRNKISALQELGNLSILPNIENLYIAGNPICESEDHKLYVVYYISSLESLDGDLVNSQLRQKATKKYSGPSPEVWVIRENLVSFRRNLSEKDQEKKKLAESVSVQEKKLEKTRSEIENIERTLEKYSIEIENIEKAMINTSESQDTRKIYMRDLIEKTETLQKSSVELQEKMSETRTMLHMNQETLDLLTRQLEDPKSSERPKLLEEKDRIKLEIQELEDNIDEYEQEYALVLENLNIATAEITKFEEEVMKLRSVTGKRSGHKKDLSFTMDSDTKLLLTTRKEEIIQQIPELKHRKQQLLKDFETQDEVLSSLLLEYRDLERETLEISRQVNDCEEFLHKLNTPSPMRSRAGNKLMWDSVKSLWQLLTDDPWEYETEDVQKGIIRWVEHMKEHVSRYKMDNDAYVQVLNQQRIDQVNISHLNVKIHELTDQLLSKNKLSEENDKLHAKIDGFREREKKLVQEQERLLQVIRKLEDKEGFFGNEEESVQVLKMEKESIKATVMEIIEKGEKEEKEIRDRMERMSGACEEKAKELSEVTERVEEKKEMLEASLKEIQEMVKKKNEMVKSLEGLAKNRQELEAEIGSMKETIKMNKPIRQIEDDKEKAVNVIKQFFAIFKLDFVDFANLKNAMMVLEEKSEKLQEDLQKAAKFKVNKQKFVEMYEANTKELHDEWDALKRAKESFEFERIHVDSMKSEKKTVDDQMKHLVQTTKELQKVKNNVEKEIIKLEEHLNSLKQSASTFEALKQKEVYEYRRVQNMSESEMRRIEEAMQELKSLKLHIKELTAEKEELESYLSSTKRETKRLEETQNALDEEIQIKEAQIHKINNRLTDEQLKAQKDLEKIISIVESKQKEINSFEVNIKSYESQSMKLQEQLAFSLSRVNSLNEEITEKDSILKERKSALREIESKYLVSEAALSRSRQETEELTQTYSYKKSKISALDQEIESKSAELEKTLSRCQQGSNELQSIQKQISRIKSDLLDIERIITSKNTEYINTENTLKQKHSELNAIEKTLSDKKSLLLQAEQEYLSIHNKSKKEQEAFNSYQEETKALQRRLIKLNDMLKRVENQKSAVLHEIEEINAKVAEEEVRHRKELDCLRNAVANGESTLRQLMESVQRCRNKLANDKEELRNVQEDFEKMIKERNAVEAVNRELVLETGRLRAGIMKIKEEEDTAIVLLALSGHKIDERVKQRITSLCRSASELQALRASVHEGNLDRETREGISETRMKQNSRGESYDGLSLLGSRTPKDYELEGFGAERTSFFRNL